MNKPLYNGIAIALAWPQTYCKQTNAWYDKPMRLLGFNRQHYYKAGHAAFVLVDKKRGTCHYFDFGRYHAPYQYGRVRSAETDPELTMQTSAKLDKNTRLANLQDILQELANRKACHGEGFLHAACCNISFEKAFQKALQLQQQSPVAYGPFVPGGTNCSRFVNTVILAGNPSFWQWLKLSLPYTLTPAPLTNVYALSPVVVVSPQGRVSGKKPGITDRSRLKTFLPAPPKPSHLPAEAQWLSGEGAGSWFAIEQNNQAYSTPPNYTISRFNPEGQLECKGHFVTSDVATEDLQTKSSSTGDFAKVDNSLHDHLFSLDLPYRFTYLSHCKQVHILQQGRIHQFNFIPQPLNSSPKNEAKIPRKTGFPGLKAVITVM